MPKPRTETAAREEPGGYRQQSDDQPTEALVAELSGWLNRPPAYVLNLLRELRFRHYAR